MKIMIQNILLLALGLFVLLVSANASENKSQIGFYGGSHLKLFMPPDDYSDINPLFTGLDNYNVEFNFGYYRGISYRYFFGKNLYFSGKIGYLGTAHSLTAEQDAILLYDTHVAKGKIYHKMNFDLDAFAFNPRIGYFFGKHRRWYVTTGISLNLYTTTGVGYQMELKSPEEKAVFKESATNKLSYKDVAIMGGNDYEFAVVGGLGYNYPFKLWQQQFSFGPYAEFAVSVNNLSQMIDERTFTLKGGVELHYEFKGEPKKSVQADVAHYYINPNTENKDLIIDKYITKNNFPLINYIFFDKGETQLPQRYKTITPEQAKFFFEEDLKASNPIMVYYHILDILGRRMSGNESINITLTKKSLNKQELNDKLFFERGRWIQEYLEKTWGISNDRVTIKTDTSPVAKRDYSAEHIEIQTNDNSLFKPVAVRDTTYTFRSRALAFNIALEDTNLKNWNFAASINGKQIAAMNGLIETNNTVEYSLENEKIETYDNEFPTLSYEFNISGSDKYLDLQRQNSVQIVPTFENYATNVFYVTWVNKSSFALEDILDFPWIDIRKAIDENSNMKIKVYIDKSLNSTISRKVAEKRLDKIMGRKEFENIKCEAEFITADPLTYNPNLPEMLLYHRCIILIIEN